VSTTENAASGVKTYTIDPVHSSAQFRIRHLTISHVRGEFEKLSGSVSFDPQNTESLAVHVEIDASSINTRFAMRDDILRGPEFFDVAKYPVIQFESRKVATEDPGALRMTGELTIHGITREVVLRVTGPSAEEKDVFGHLVRAATATTTIKRSDFGLTWNQPLEDGGSVLGDDVEITIDVEFF
jgi:polyisoprenoid-binding protein YceI